MDEREVVARRYGEHLTEHDLAALVGGRPEAAQALRRHPSLLLDLLDRPSVTDGLLDAYRDTPARLCRLSPFLVFAAAVHRVGGALVSASHAPERAGPRSRIPVFDGPVLAAFAAEPAHRLFLAELLASYARVASGVTWRRTERGWQRQRWDGLDLPALANLLAATPDPQRTAVWRRIGDGALFLAGVFPDYAERSLGLVEVARLQRVTGLPLSDVSTPVPGLLEEIAGFSYGHVGAAVPAGVRRSPASARRLLALVADSYIYPLASGWTSDSGT